MLPQWVKDNPIKTISATAVLIGSLTGLIKMISDEAQEWVTLKYDYAEVRESDQEGVKVGGIYKEEEKQMARSN